MNQQTSYLIQAPVLRTRLTVAVPGSKSITNRALLLSALSDGSSVLSHALFSDDSRAFISALKKLGIRITENEDSGELLVQGCHGRLPIKRADLNAHSSGTTARFLTALLSFSEGEFFLDASEQMKKRPMKPLLQALTTIGADITSAGDDGFLPLRIHGSRFLASDRAIKVNVDQSTQFLSALMMTGCLLEKGITLQTEGKRTAFSYVKITEQLMRSFSVFPECHMEHGCLTCRIPGNSVYHAGNYVIEPDISGACYFFAAAALLGNTVMIPGVFPSSLQGDIRFLEILSELGCTINVEKEGTAVTGPANGHFHGIDVTMTDFSDQTMTMAVLAMFADSPTHIREVAHIRFQECDRMNAIITEIRRLGGNASVDEAGTGLVITPGDTLHGALVETYQDHRMAMAFALAGLRIPGVTILNPSCCKKTFENYFTLFTECFQ